MSVLIQKMRTMRGLPAPERRLALLAVGIMAVVRLALWVAPFRRIKRWAERQSRARVSRARLSARQIAWAVKLASRYVPGASCLTQALTAQFLLNRAGVENHLHIGVAFGAADCDPHRRSFEAHAWVEHEGTVLVGGADQSSRFAPILTLHKPPAAG